MAEEDDLDPGGEEGGKSGGKLKMIIMIVGGVVLIDTVAGCGAPSAGHYHRESGN